MFVPMALIAFWPSPVDQRIQGQLATVLEFLHAHGMPALVNYKFVEASANVLLFIPLGFVAAHAFPQNHWWQTGAFGLLVSGCIELGQLLFLHNRFASALDLVANSGGAAIGALLAAGLLSKLRARAAAANL